jgi:hypothetical protein
MDLPATFAALDTAAIDAFVAEAQEEHLLLDFKRVARDDLSRDDDKRNLAKALSGFANSAGGLIVWGVDARKDAEGVDRAVGTEPIPNAARFVSRLNELTGELVTPLVDGVRHRAIPLAASGASGYAVSLIPPSDAGPHMAKGPEHRYYKRSGDSFYKMEHFDLEDMFGRRRRPRLVLEHRVVPTGTGSSGGAVEHQGRLVLSLRNAGRGVARAPYLEVATSGEYRMHRFGIDGNGFEGLPRLRHAGEPNVVRYGADASAVIHAGVSLDVAAVAVAAVVPYGGAVRTPPPLALTYTVAAEDVQAATGRLDVAGEGILDALLPPAARPA